jgi:hypothetical protein
MAALPPFLRQVNERRLTASPSLIAACQLPPTFLPFRAGAVDQAGIAEKAAVPEPRRVRHNLSIVQVRTNGAIDPRPTGILS